MTMVEASSPEEALAIAKVSDNYVAQTKEQLPKFMQSIASSIEDRYIDAHIPEEWGW